jgi:hypothetical protein
MLTWRFNSQSNPTFVIIPTNSSDWWGGGGSWSKISLDKYLKMS